jgi:hypothetical protein
LVVEEVGPAAARDDILDHLADLLAHRDSRTLVWSASAVGALDPAAARDDILEHLVDLLSHANPLVRGTVVRAVRALGPAAARDDVVDRLAGLLAHTDSYARSKAAQILGNDFRAGIRIFRRLDRGGLLPGPRGQIRTVAELSRWNVPGKPTDKSGVFGS